LPVEFASSLAQPANASNAHAAIVRREAGTALLVLDMVSEFRFPDAEPLLRGARRPAD
jgi:hypothetical protein